MEGEDEDFHWDREAATQALIGGSADHYPLCFGLVTAKASAHTELLSLLQAEIVAPLVERRLVREFRVLTATPPSFVAEDSTLLVFELIVPCPISITDWEVEQWQERLGSDVCLVVIPSKPPAGMDSWDSRRARAVLERVMRQGPVRRKSSRSAVPWLFDCVDRSNIIDDPPDRKVAEIVPSLFATDEKTGQRVPLPAHMPGTLMSEAIAKDLCQHLPVALRWRTCWRLIYSPRIHGVSLQTFYRRAQEEGPTLLIVQDHKGFVFGGFASATWHIADRYFGDGECFVFKFRKRLAKPVVSLTRQLELSAGSAKANLEEPTASAAIHEALESIREWQRQMAAQAEKAERVAAMSTSRITSPTEALDALDETKGGQRPSSCSEPSSPIAGGDDEPDPDPEDLGEGGEDDENERGLEVYHWSSKDAFFLYSDLECIGMGGGSAFALYLDKDLLHGVSEPCSTFASEQLSCTDNFIISDMEVWAFDDPSEKRPPRRTSAR